jgi:hypothetical protein
MLKFICTYHVLVTHTKDVHTRLASSIIGFNSLYYYILQDLRVLLLEITLAVYKASSKEAQPTQSIHTLWLRRARTPCFQQDYHLWASLHNR